MTKHGVTITGYAELDNRLRDLPGQLDEVLSGPDLNVAALRNLFTNLGFEIEAVDEMVEELQRNDIGAPDAEG